MPEICEACKKEFKTKKALIAHSRFHCKAGAGAAGGSAPQKKLCDCPDGGQWIMLDPQKYAHIIQHTNPKTGKPYMKICSVCQEVV